MSTLSWILLGVIVFLLLLIGFIFYGINSIAKEVVGFIENIKRR